MGRKRRQKKANQKEKLQTMGEAAGAASAYRPHMQQAMNAAMQQQLAMYQPAQQLLGQMYGLGVPGGQGFGGIVGQDMMQVGQTSRAPGFAPTIQPGGTHTSQFGTGGTSDAGNFLGVPHAGTPPGQSSGWNANNQDIASSQQAMMQAPASMQGPTQVPGQMRQRRPAQMQSPMQILGGAGTGRRF